MADTSWQLSGSLKSPVKMDLTARLMVAPAGTAPAGTVSRKPWPGQLRDWWPSPVTSITVSARTSAANSESRNESRDARMKTKGKGQKGDM